MKLLHHIVLTFVILWTCNLTGQEVIQKASRSDLRSYGKEIKMVSVFGEKATVTVRGADVTEVKVLLRPVSRNSDREKAAADLKYINYSVEKEGDRLIIRNFFRGNPGQITSNLSMDIEIVMPHSVQAVITNLYGPVKISNIALVNATVSFGSLHLTGISSESIIKARYSDMELEAVCGKLEITSEKSDINVAALDAATVINCSYGTAELETAGPGPLIVRGYRTTVNIMADEPGKYQYNLRSAQGTIIMPDGKQYRNQPVEVTPLSPAGLIDVTTSYCDITIAKK